MPNNDSKLKDEELNKVSGAGRTSFYYTEKCPRCNNDTKVEYKYTFFGDLVVSSGVCSNCNYDFKKGE